MDFTDAMKREDKSHPKINATCLYSGIWYQEGDKWKSYDIVQG